MWCTPLELGAVMVLELLLQSDEISLGKRERGIVPHQQLCVGERILHVRLAGLAVRVVMRNVTPHLQKSPCCGEQIRLGDAERPRVHPRVVDHVLEDRVRARRRRILCDSVHHIRRHTPTRDELPVHIAQAVRDVSDDAKEIVGVVQLGRELDVAGAPILELNLSRRWQVGSGRRRRMSARVTRRRRSPCTTRRSLRARV